MNANWKRGGADGQRGIPVAEPERHGVMKVSERGRRWIAVILFVVFGVMIKYMGWLEFLLMGLVVAVGMVFCHAQKKVEERARERIRANLEGWMPLLPKIRRHKEDNKE